MRCNICDRQLSDKEISWNKEINNFECCGTCLEISLEAAFSDGFLKEDDDHVLIDNDSNLSDVFDFSFQVYNEDETGEFIE